VERAEYAEQVSGQLAAAQVDAGPGELSQLLASGGTWQV
jgi:hypothetical protein